MTDRVVLCEGIKDTRFLTQIYRNVCRSDNFDIFDNKNSEMNESRRISRHNMGSKYDILFKSEGSKNELIEIFSVVGPTICDLGMILSIIIDLDGKSTNDLLREFDNALKREYQNNGKIVLVNQVNDSHACFIDCRLKRHRTNIGNVHIVAFHEDMEAAVGIGDREDKVVQIKKINRFIENFPDESRRIADVISR